MKYLNYTLIIPIVLILLLSFSNIKEDQIVEEATPIRYGGLIKGMKYDIKIKDSNKDKIIYKTKALDSINHYTDISTLNNFYINFNLSNDSKDKYFLKKIIITNKDKIIKSYNYQNIINNSEVDIKLSSKIFDKIYDGKKVIGNIKIIIEK